MGALNPECSRVLYDSLGEHLAGIVRRVFLESDAAAPGCG
jgi:hypothetical protein